MLAVTSIAAFPAKVVASKPVSGSTCSGLSAKAAGDISSGSCPFSNSQGIAHNEWLKTTASPRQ